MEDATDGAVRLMRITAPTTERLESRRADIVSTIGADTLATVNDGDPKAIYVNAPTEDATLELAQKLNDSGIDLSDWAIETCVVGEDGKFTDVNSVDLSETVGYDDLLADVEDEVADAKADSIAASEQLEALRAKEEENRLRIAEQRRAAEQARKEADEAKAKAEEAKREAEERERLAAEADDEARQLAIATTKEGMLDYVTTLELSEDDLDSSVLPKFAPTDAADTIFDAVSALSTEQEKSHFLAIVPSVSLSVDDADANVDSDDDEGMEDEARVAYISETGALAAQYANDRASVRHMSQADYEFAQAKAAEIINDKLAKRMARVDATRGTMYDDMEKVREAIAGYRTDYADGMRSAMEAAAIEAAREYAEQNRDSIIDACESVMLEHTADVADSLAANAVREYEILMYADRYVDDDDTLTDKQRDDLHAYLSAARYRVMSDRTMGTYVSLIANDRLDEREDIDFADELPEDEAADDAADVADDSATESENPQDDGDDVPADEGGDDIAAQETGVIPALDEVAPLPDDTAIDEVPPAAPIDGVDDDELIGLVDGADGLPDADAFDVGKDDIDAYADDAKGKKHKKAKRERKPLSKGVKIGLGVAGGVIAAVIAGIGLFNVFAPSGISTTETTTDPHGLYEVGDSYTVNVTKDNKTSETTITIEKFVDSTDDSKDIIIATDANGTEYTITYDKMDEFAKSKKNSDASKTEDEATSNQENPQGEAADVNASAHKMMENASVSDDAAHMA